MKFKKGDLIEPTDEAREKFRFNKNQVFPWKVINNNSPSLWVERYSKIAKKPRRELWHERYFKLSEEDTQK